MAYRVSILRTDVLGDERSMLLFEVVDVDSQHTGQGPEYSAVRAVYEMLKQGALGECEIDIRVRKIG